MRARSPSCTTAARGAPEQHSVGPTSPRHQQTDQHSRAHTTRPLHNTCATKVPFWEPLNHGTLCSGRNLSIFSILAALVPPPHRRQDNGSGSGGPRSEGARPPHTNHLMPSGLVYTFTKKHTCTKLSCPLPSRGGGSSASTEASAARFAVRSEVATPLPHSYYFITAAAAAAVRPHRPALLAGKRAISWGPLVARHCLWS